MWRLESKVALIDNLLDYLPAARGSTCHTMPCSRLALIAFHTCIIATWFWNKPPWAMGVTPYETYGASADISGFRNCVPSPALEPNSQINHSQGLGAYFNLAISRHARHASSYYILLESYLPAYPLLSILHGVRVLKPKRVKMKHRLTG